MNRLSAKNRAKIRLVQPCFCGRTRIIDNAVTNKASKLVSIITMMNSRQWSRSFFVILFVTWVWFAHGIINAEEPENFLSSSEDAVQQTEDKTADVSSQEDSDAILKQAISLEQQGKYKEAIKTYGKAIQISPKNVLAYNNLAWLLATCPDNRFRNGKVAIAFAVRACKLTNAKNFSTIDTLGIALAEAGEFQKAIDLFTKLREKVPAAEREKIDRRLALFREGKTYFQSTSTSPSSSAQPADKNSKIDQELGVMLLKASSLERAGRFAEAAEQYGKMVDRAKKIYGPQSPVAVRLMVRQGDKCFETKQFDKALSLFKEALPILRSHLPREDKSVTYCVNELAITYDQLGQYEKAIELHTENLAVRESSLGKDHPHVLISLQNIASTRIGMQQYEKALGILNDWLVRNERGLGEKHTALPKIYSMLGSVHGHLHNPVEAEKCFTRALEFYRTQKKPVPLQEAHILRNLAILRVEVNESSKFEEAKQYATRAVEITTKVCGENNCETASAKRVLANVYIGARKFTEAEPLLRDAVQVVESLQGKDDPTAALWRIELARLYMETGSADKAETLCLHCIDVMESLYGIKLEQPLENSLALLAEIAGRTGHQDQAKSRINQLVHVLVNRLDTKSLLLANVSKEAGEAYCTLGCYDEAKTHYTRCFEIQQAKLGPDHLEVGKTLQRLGWLCLRASRYAEAESLYRKCFQIYRTKQGNDDLLVASALCDLGFLYMRMIRYHESEACLKEAVRIAKKNSGKFASDILSSTLSHWGRLCSEKGAFDRAESLHKQALPMIEKNHGTQSPAVAWQYVYLAQLYTNTKQYSEAEPLYRKAIAIFESTLGKGHPAAHVPLSGLGRMLCETRRYNEAEPLLQRSLDYAKTDGKVNVRDQFCILKDLAELHLQRRRFKKAVHYAMKSQQAHHSFVHHVLPGLSPSEQLAYLSSTWQRSLACWLSVGLNFPENEEIVNASAEWLLNGKSLSTELLAQQIQLVRQSNDPALAATVRELNKVRGRMAHMAHDPESANSEAIKLGQRELALARQLGRQTATTVQESPWVTLDEVRKNIPEKSVLIEIAKFPIYYNKNKKTELQLGRARYVAWVIPPKNAGNVTLVDLGDSERIDEAVAKCRQHMEFFPEIVDKLSVRQATAVAKTDIIKLSALIWEPLKKSTNNSWSLIISPDGGLWLYPWEALTDVVGNFLIETRQVSYLSTGRQLTFRNPQKASTTAAIFTDPDYDAKLSELGLSTMENWANFAKSLMETKTTADDRIERLPDTVAETNALINAVQEYVKVKPVVYQDKKASENEFKKLQSPRVLLIRTHGHFIQDQAFDNMPLTKDAKRIWDRYNKDRFFSDGKSKERWIVPNPLLRCGLSMAGANRFRQAAGANDGVLTGIEILNTDLSGTELVVLCACETGVGAVRNAEGAAGLCYAFQLAGAKNIVATSWNIPIRPSSELMQTFFHNLAEKQEKVMALRNAQLSLIKNIRKATGGVHPAQWAGYTIIGNVN